MNVPLQHSRQLKEKSLKKPPDPLKEPQSVLPFTKLLSAIQTEGSRGSHARDMTKRCSTAK